jgi:hypothetical protein
VSLGQIRVLHVPSSLQFTDIMTKGLPSQLFLDFRYSLCVRPPDALTVGDVRVYLLYRLLGNICNTIPPPILFIFGLVGLDCFLALQDTLYCAIYTMKDDRPMCGVFPNILVLMVSDTK